MMKTKSLQSLLPNYGEADQKLIRSARVYAEEAHRGQKRKSGQDYITHPLAVAQYAAGLGMDGATVAAALLHDVVEDTDRTIEDIRESFGDVVAGLVEGVTKLGEVEYGYDGSTQQRTATSAENLRKLLLAMSRDLRVIVIKLLDRLHNLQTLKALKPEDRQRIAQESLDIFAPLADRLGMGAIKAEIEDLGFMYAHPSAYELVRRLVRTGVQDLNQDLEKLKEVIQKQLTNSGIDALRIDARQKHYYSIYKKLQKTDGDIAKIYDLTALRIIVSTIQDCYQVLGLLHMQYKPLIHRIKDYIAVPKPNGYRSLHTTVITSDGTIVEIQVRTQEMHDEAEYGLAAHVLYNLHKDTKAYKDGKPASVVKPAWLGELGRLSVAGQSFSELVEDLKIDLFQDRIFIFSPRGDLYDLPEGATPVDFAFAVHSDVGLRTYGAKVNNKIVSLTRPLENRDIVEILTKKMPCPNRAWLGFVKTSQARSKIRSYFRSQSRDINVQHGLELLNARLRAVGINKLEDVGEDRVAVAIESLNYRDKEGLLAAVGEGTLNPATVLRKLVPAAQKPAVPKQTAAHITGRAIVSGAPEVPCHSGACCNPTPPESIIGYITRGSGITVHRLGCINLPDEADRLIACEWETISSGYGDAESTIIITASSRIGLIRDITGVIASMNINIVKITSQEKVVDKKFSRIEVTINANDIVLISQVIQRLEAVNAVQSAENLNKELIHE